MSHRIPIGTEIFPYSSESGEVGIGRLTTVEVELDDTAQRLTHGLDLPSVSMCLLRS